MAESAARRTLRPSRVLTFTGAVMFAVVTVETSPAAAIARRNDKKETSDNELHGDAGTAVAVVYRVDTERRKRREFLLLPLSQRLPKEGFR